MHLPYLVAIFFFLQGSPRRCNSTFIVKSFVDVSFSSLAILCHLYPSPAVSCLFVSLFLLRSKEWVVDWDSRSLLHRSTTTRPGTLHRRDSRSLLHRSTTTRPGTLHRRIGSTATDTPFEIQDPFGSGISRLSKLASALSMCGSLSPNFEKNVSFRIDGSHFCTCVGPADVFFCASSIQDTKGTAKSRAYKLRFELMARRCGLL
uniref:Uncharacterized protein n=1 Tax=Chromera velia CCMP2878 TaxID=1169474 RepID=A0A0G4FJT8_9ALVE|eukprot:Cvel_17416.t1-p1 / transcript=Cvel_17416.t1 / gene=Cvel_17416 / organism=Chromera_velia_CCMP2878 / gene_product=hypothetical protein / transcript_product=hypothetical protein / location=Cvel_scaffold1387:37178-47503(+) / protein_length=203 / sequence_SO=supercontig / SO=protein_coding / is_pseudo=false